MCQCVKGVSRGRVSRGPCQGRVKGTVLLTHECQGVKGTVLLTHSKYGVKGTVLLTHG